MNGEEFTLQGTIDELWPWASLRAKESGRGIDAEILDQINWFLAQEFGEEARTSPHLPIGARASVSARRCFEVLSENGYKQFLPAIREMQIGIDKIKRIFLQALVRQLLLNKIPKSTAGEVMRVLSTLIESGDWPTWRADWDTWEDEVCAKLAAETAPVA